MKSNGAKQERKWLTKKEAMKYLSISQRTIENHVNRGFLIAYQLGGKVFFDQNEIDETLSMSRRG